MNMENNETERNDSVVTDTDEAAAAPRQKRLPMWLLAAVGVIVIIVLAVVLTSGSSPNGGGGLAVSIDAPAEVSEGSEFTVQVKVADLVNFDSANYDIKYDPAVIEVTAVTNGSVSSEVIPIAIWQFDPSGVQGKVRIINNVRGLIGVNGSGYLAEVHFQVVGSSGDASDLEFKSECVLFNVEAVEIPAEWTDGSVRVK
jgi:hypothetical protein